MIGLLLGLAFAAPISTDASELVGDSDAAETSATVASMEGPDRSAPPQVLPPSPLDLPSPDIHELSPGLNVHHLRIPGVRKAHVKVVFRRGALELHGGSNAVFTVTGLAWDQATLSTSADDLARLQDLHEVEVFSDGGLQAASVRCVTPVDNLPVGLGLLRQVLFEPKFRRKDIQQFRQRWQRWYLSEAPTRSDSITDSVLVHGWYPKGHPYASRPDLAGWRDVSRGDVLRTHARLIAESPVDVMVVADLPWTELEPMLREALEGLGATGALPVAPVVDPPVKTRVIGVHLGATKQASIALRLPAPRFDDPDAAAMYAVDWALGGGFLSRLNSNLREEKGLTYGISSDYAAHIGRGSWTVRTQVKAEELGVAVKEIEREIDGVVSDGLTEQELADALAGRITRWNGTLASAHSASSVYGSMQRHRRSVAEVRERLDAIADVDLVEAQRVAARWFASDQPRLWVIVGDQKKLEPLLDELGWDVRWMPSELTVLGILHLDP
ncbi:MAG: zinc protease [Kiritimatiellia bacterium]|jgi:zinc protease